MGIYPLPPSVFSILLLLPHPSSPLAWSPQQQFQWQDLAGKLCERMTRCVISALDHYAIPFADMMSPFLNFYVEKALIELDAATVSSGWNGLDG